MCIFVVFRIFCILSPIFPALFHGWLFANAWNEWIIGNGFVCESERKAADWWSLDQYGWYIVIVYCCNPRAFLSSLSALILTWPTCHRQYMAYQDPCHGQYSAHVRIKSVIRNMSSDVRLPVYLDHVQQLEQREIREHHDREGVVVTHRVVTLS